MRRSLALRIGVLVLVVFTTTAPAFAAPPTDDSPIGIVSRVIERVIKQVQRLVHPTDLTDVNVPKP